MRDSFGALALPDEYHEVVGNVSVELVGSELVKSGYDWYSARYPTSEAGQRSTNGKVFEGLVLTALYRAGIHPAYYQARVAHIPNVIYDILLFNQFRPVVLSCKVSLRERWKQADYEGLSLRQVYRGAYSVLLTMSNEGHGIQQRIENQEIFGLDECAVIGADDRFDQLIEMLQSRTFERAEPVTPVTGRIMLGGH